MFKQVCAARGITMTKTVIEWIKHYVNEQTTDPNLLRRMQQIETEQQTGLVQDVRGTWVPKEQLEESYADEWRHHL